MKITLRLIVSLVFGVAVIFFAFAMLQNMSERERLERELSHKAQFAAGTLKSVMETFLKQSEFEEKIKAYLADFSYDHHLRGIMVRLNTGEVVAFPPELKESKQLSEESELPIRNAETVDLFTEWKGKSAHFYTTPLIRDGRIFGSISVLHDSSYVDQHLQNRLRDLLLIFFVLVLVIGMTTALLMRWTVLGPLSRVSEWTKRLGKGKAGSHAELLEDKGEIGKLLFEVATMASSLKAKRVEVSLNKPLAKPGPVQWDKTYLRKKLKSLLGKNKLFVVANREPYRHMKVDGKVKCIFPASGMVSALDPVLQATEGLWVAHGSGDADKEMSDENGRVQVPPDNPSYTLKRVWLSEREEKGFYFGFSNEGIWPLCHIAHTRPIFRLKDWETYKKVNRKFAEALLKELDEDSPYILVQDYHFALVPKYIKEVRPNARVGLFWHIPWPNPEVFGICPWKEEILKGMLASDLIGFHTQYHCNNFLDTVDRILESRIDWNHFAVTKDGSNTLVRPFPISIDPFEKKIKEKNLIGELKSQYGVTDKIIGLGVDRIDYIKGLLERFIALERLFEKYPKYVGELVFVELGAPSRSSLPGYKNHIEAVKKQVERINKKYGREDYQPVIFSQDHHPPDIVQAFYKLADFCVVNSLHDGMNLVAKEYVAAKEDHDGALVLSRFTGASLELKGAILVNPYNIEETADAMHQAIRMAPEEKKGRMKRMQQIVRENNVFRWAGDLITELVESY